MEKLFGTDGIRGVFGEELTGELAMKVGTAVSLVLKENLGKEKLTLLLGTDTRISKDYLSACIKVGALSVGCDIVDVGVLPTPAISYLVGKYGFDGAFVVSASHNTSEHNGIKILDKDGFKLSSELEQQCENLISCKTEISFSPSNIGVCKNQYGDSDYVEHLLLHGTGFKNDFNVLVDVANGAAYRTARRSFNAMCHHVDFINCQPDGYNINENCGSTNIEVLKNRVLEGGYDVGIAFDGDADRCIMVDELGNIIDGDFILAIAAKDLKDRGLLTNNTVVGTIMSNVGLTEFCKNNGINLVKTQVGDKYVLEEMLEKGYILGGEQSGHIIFSKYANTGDGELTARIILGIMQRSRKKLSELASVMKKYPQTSRDIKVNKEDKELFKSSTVIQDYIEECKKSFGDSYNLVVRPSGTENCIRVTLQGADKNDIDDKRDEIVSFIYEQLKREKPVRERE